MRSGPTHTRRLVTALVAMTLIAAGSVVTTAGAGTGCASATNVGHGWTLINPPPGLGVDGVAGQGSVPPRYTDFTTVPGEPATLLVSDGAEIWRSGDAGCSWQSVYSIGTDLPAAWETTPYTVTQFAAADPGTHGGDRVYALLTPGFNTSFVLSVGVAAPTLVLLSTDGGKTWTLRQPPAGPDVVGQPRCLGVTSVSVSPADQQVIDMVCVGGAADQLAEGLQHQSPHQAFRSTNGGVTWQQMNYPISFGANNLAADPYSPNVIWAVGESPVSGSYYLTVYRSADGGATWSTHRMSKGGLGPTWTLTVAPAASGRTAVFASTLPIAIYESTDGTGARWRQDPIDKHVTPLLATGSFAADQRDLLSSSTFTGCQLALTLHRITRRGTSQLVRVPSQAYRAWTNWHYTGGSHPSIVGWAPNACAGSVSLLLRYQP